MDIEKQKKVFGIQAEDYTKYRKPYPKELTELFFSLFPKDGKHILDIACGTGKSTEPLQREGVELFGCDHDPLMIKEAQKQAALKNLPITYSVAEVEHLPFEDNYFDAVTVGTAFHWFVNEVSIQEMLRVLKPGGLVFLYWSLGKKHDEGDGPEVWQVFKKYNWEKLPSELRDTSYIKSFLTQNGLESVSSAVLADVYTETLDERVGLEKTNSGYGLLSEENKKLFLEDLKNVLVSMLGDRPYFKVQKEIHVCYGYKNK